MNPSEAVRRSARTLLGRSFARPHLARQRSLFARIGFQKCTIHCYKTLDVLVRFTLSPLDEEAQIRSFSRASVIKMPNAVPVQKANFGLSRTGFSNALSQTAPNSSVVIKACAGRMVISNDSDAATSPRARLNRRA